MISLRRESEEIPVLEPLRSQKKKLEKQIPYCHNLRNGDLQFRLLQVPPLSLSSSFNIELSYIFSKYVESLENLPHFQTQRNLRE